jgi:GrpB-like predicted nucleotidyltransferase (UPF0157 family)
LERHPSLDDRFDPAVRIVDYDPAWPALADAKMRRVKDTLGEVAVRVEHVGSTAEDQASWERLRWRNSKGR